MRTTFYTKMIQIIFSIIVQISVFLVNITLQSSNQIPTFRLLPPTILSISGYTGGSGNLH